MDIEIHCNTDDATLLRNVESAIARPLEWLAKIDAHDGHAVIVGGGPSAADCLDSIRWRQSLGHKIFALNGAAGFLSAAGVTPDYQVIVDARPHNARMVGAAGRYMLASQCDPSVFDAAPADRTTMWHPAIDGVEERAGAAREYALIGGGTTVGLSAMCLAYAMGFRALHLYGYDSSHRAGAGHAYDQPENATEPVVSVNAYGCDWQCSLAMAYQAELFPECANSLIELGCVITMDGDGLLPTAFRHLWSEPTPMTEAEKYTAMWSLPQYRAVAPGELVADLFATMSKVGPDDTVIDFGCGTGRGARRVHELTGCQFLLLDFTENSLDADVATGGWFMRAQHDLTAPIPARADHGFCTDVMEHIPPAQVDDVIRNVMTAAKKVFFQISLIDDNCGALIGRPLHLSVHPAPWWAAAFQHLGYAIDYIMDDADSAVFYITNPLTT